MNIFFQLIRYIYLKTFILRTKVISTVIFIPFLYFLGWILASPLVFLGIEKEKISLIGTIITFLIFVISLPKWFEVRWKLNNVWKLVGIKKTNRNRKSSFYFLKGLLGAIILLSAILQAPLLEEANPNVTPNPAKAPWYFLGLQELLSYWDPQIAGVMIPLLLGVVLWMAFPYIDRNPETHPSKRKFAIMFYTFFLAGAGILTIIGVLFRGPGWNWTYPWIDGIWFDDLLDWIHFD